MSSGTLSVSAIEMGQRSRLPLMPVTARFIYTY